MGYSNLTNVVIMSPNHSGRRSNAVSKITIHHMAGNLSVETCGNVFLNPNAQASANYGIGSDGRIACYVDEDNHAWTSANWANDDRAITIEVANSASGGDWPISQEAYASLISLCADICNRYGIYPYYDGTPSATLTEHCMFVATMCPGPTIHAMQVNHVIENDIRAAMAGGVASSPQSTQHVVGEVEDLARRAIAGEFGNGNDRVIALGGLYQQVQNRINEIYGGVQSAPVYSVDDIARRVIAGEFGNGQDRINALASAGYDNVAVQQRVNELLGYSGAAQPSANLEAVAAAVYRGEYGNGQDRINNLRNAGYDPQVIQDLVNRIYYS